MVPILPPEGNLREVKLLGGILTHPTKETQNTGSPPPRVVLPTKRVPSPPTHPKSNNGKQKNCENSSLVKYTAWGRLIFKTNENTYLGGVYPPDSWGPGGGGGRGGPGATGRLVWEGEGWGRGGSETPPLCHGTKIRGRRIPIPPLQLGDLSIVTWPQGQGPQAGLYGKERGGGSESSPFRGRGRWVPRPSPLCHGKIRGRGRGVPAPPYYHCGLDAFQFTPGHRAPKRAAAWVARRRARLSLAGWRP